MFYHHEPQLDPAPPMQHAPRSPSGTISLEHPAQEGGVRGEEGGEAGMRL